MESKKSTRIVRDLAPEGYRLPDDKESRKLKSVLVQRRAVANQLETYANSDGTSIWVGADKLARQLGLSRRAIFND